MKIVFNEAALKPQHYKKELIKAFASVIDSGIFLHGSQNALLLKNLQHYLKNPFVTLTSSGHSALQSALTSLFLKPTDEVIFPVNSYPTAFPIALSQAKPVPVDVDQNGLIDPQEVAKKINRKTRAVVAVHLYGLSADIGTLKKIIAKRNIVLVEDCAQAFGTKYKERLVGSFGDFSCFSFYPTKNLATLGDGGALCTKKKKQYGFFQRLISYGENLQHQSEFVAGHSRLPELQAAVLNVYLKSIDKEIELKKAVCEEYFQYIKYFKLEPFVRPLFHKKNSSPNLHLFAVEAKKRDKLKEYLMKKAIETSIHYPLPIHLVPAFSYLKHRRGSFPVAERLSRNILSFPFHSYITKNHVRYIIEAVKEFYA